LLLSLRKDYAKSVFSEQNAHGLTRMAMSELFQWLLSRRLIINMHVNVGTKTVFASEMLTFSKGMLVVKKINNLTEKQSKSVS